MNVSLCQLLRRKISKNGLQSLANYSRKRNATGNNGAYKIVKSESNIDDVGNLNQVNNTNWEFFASDGYPFYMPGHVGPAWQNTETSETYTNLPMLIGLTDVSKHSAIKNEPKKDEIEKKETKEKNFQCIVQECPMVLRRSVSELFTGRDLKNAAITVVTLIQKPNFKQLKSDREIITEKLAKSFVLAAQDICMTLTIMGYWADFINPFSGKPYLAPVHNSRLYDTDERFRCLDFEIIQQQNCIVIANESGNQNIRTFVGSLFTNAPHNISYLQDLKNHFFLNQ